jgi:microcystin-dependent protein
LAVKRWLNDRPQYHIQGQVASGYKLYFYEAGTSTKQNTYTDSTGSTANQNPITLDSNGRPPNEIWMTVGERYKALLSADVTNDPPTSTVWSEDEIIAINDSTSVFDQWIVGSTPTYISANSLSIPGDETSIYTVGRRIKTINAGVASYHTIRTSTYSSVTTLVLNNDSGSEVTAEVSAVYYGIVSSANTSAPSQWQIGDFKTTFRTSLEAGWLWMNGANVSRTTYASLFAAIGTVGGIGDGSTTFTLPDMRGVVPAGVDPMGGSSTRGLITSAVSGLNGTVLGGTGGSQLAHAHSHTFTGGSATTSSDGAHTHSTTIPLDGGGSAVASVTTQNALTTAAFTSSSNGAHTHTVTATGTISTALTGTTQNLQPTILCVYMIKAF